MRDSLKTAFKRAIINCSKFLTASFKEGDLRKGSFYPLSGVSEKRTYYLVSYFSPYPKSGSDI